MHPLMLGCWIWGGLLALLLVCLVARWFLTRSIDPFLPWVTRPLDQKARNGNRCRVLHSFPDRELTDVRIEWVDPSCENGLPHTSDANTIRISQDMWERPDREATLRHERVHILQRRFPQLWGNFYADAWDYTLHTSPPPHFPADTLEQIRSNPDTAEKPWAVWKNRYWFVPIYRNTDTPVLQDVEVRVWDSQQGSWSALPAKWRQFFCGDSCPHQYEHPHEIAAELWTHPSRCPASDLLNKFMTTFSDPNKISREQ